MTALKGILALDIDGTITVQKHSLEQEVSFALNQYGAEGWILFFITGRTFSFAQPVLATITQPYFFAVQNGAAVYQMPEGELIEKNYLDAALIPELLNAVQKGLLIESGKDHEDICYYRPSDFQAADQEYINFRIEISPEEWKGVRSFDDIPLREFAVGKFFAASKDQTQQVADQLKRFKVMTIRDPFRKNHYLAHINHPKATKGEALAYLIRRYSNLPIIAAGDDYNDVEMLEKATFKIMMGNAPKELHQLGDLLAKPVEQLGIIPALKEATKLYGSNH